MKRAQASFDFLILWAILLIIFVILVQFMVVGRYTKSINTQTELRAQEQAEHVAFVINSLYLSGEGSNLTFFVDSSLAKGVAFNLTVYDEGFVVVDYLRTEQSVALLTHAVNQSVLSAGTHVASFQNGVITFV